MKKITNDGFNIKNYTDNNELPAKRKLTEYVKKIEHSDFCNSYTRYSLEAKLLDDAIKEAQDVSDENSLEQLLTRKAEINKKLKEMGFEIKD